MIDVFDSGGRFDAVMSDKIIDKPFESGSQPDILEDGRTQVSGKTMHLVYDLIDVMEVLFAFIFDRLLIRLQVLFYETDPELQDCQRPPELIMQFSCNPPPFGFPELS